MSLEGQIALALSITAIIIPIVFKLYNVKKTRDIMKHDAEMLCRDLKRILTDFDKDNEEELYEIDLSLTSYFKDNSLRIQELSIKLTQEQPWYYPKNNDLLIIGRMLEWMIRDFYNIVSEEEERIRIWSQNVPSFHSKYSDSFHKESIMTFPPQ